MRHWYVKQGAMGKCQGGRGGEERGVRHGAQANTWFAGRLRFGSPAGFSVFRLDLEDLQLPNPRSWGFSVNFCHS